MEDRSWLTRSGITGLGTAYVTSRWSLFAPVDSRTRTPTRHLENRRKRKRNRCRRAGWDLLHYFPWPHCRRDVASSVWDIWPSEHSSCRGARWGLILLNRCGRKLGRRLVWLNCKGGCRRYLIRLSGSRLHLIQLNWRRLIRLN